jgi:hypothetical protein
MPRIYVADPMALAKADAQAFAGSIEPYGSWYK